MKFEYNLTGVASTSIRRSRFRIACHKNARLHVGQTVADAEVDTGTVG